MRKSLRENKLRSRIRHILGEQGKQREMPKIDIDFFTQRPPGAKRYAEAPKVKDRPMLVQAGPTVGPLAQELWEAQEDLEAVNLEMSEKLAEAKKAIENELGAARREKSEKKEKLANEVFALLLKAEGVSKNSAEMSEVATSFYRTFEDLIIGARPHRREVGKASLAPAKKLTLVMEFLQENAPVLISQIEEQIKVVEDAMEVPEKLIAGGVFVQKPPVKEAQEDSMLDKLTGWFKRAWNNLSKLLNKSERLTDEAYAVLDDLYQLIGLEG